MAIVVVVVQNAVEIQNVLTPLNAMELVGVSERAHTHTCTVVSTDQDQYLRTGAKHEKVRKRKTDQLSLPTASVHFENQSCSQSCCRRLIPLLLPFVSSHV